jgi:cell division FtsZ-interacting protein ZapD
MNRVISFKTAKGVWDELRRIYARDGLQQLDRKNEAFASYLPLATTQVVDVAVMLNQLQDEIGEMDIEERLGDSKKTSRFLTIMRARGSDYKMAAA